jgi:hypothetical protein
MSPRDIPLGISLSHTAGKEYHVRAMRSRFVASLLLQNVTLSIPRPGGGGLPDRHFLFLLLGRSGLALGQPISERVSCEVQTDRYRYRLYPPPRVLKAMVLYSFIPSCTQLGQALHRVLVGLACAGRSYLLQFRNLADSIKASCQSRTGGAQTSLSSLCFELGRIWTALHTAGRETGTKMRRCLLRGDVRLENAGHCVVVAAIVPG